MIQLMILAAAVVAAGPFKFDGANIPGPDLVTSGIVSMKSASAMVTGGRVELGVARQKAIDAKFASGSGTLFVSIVDNASADTTVLTFGMMRLVRKLDIWYLVNTTGGQWRQMPLGAATKGAPLRLAVVENSGSAFIYRDGKEFGVTPYDTGASQPLAIGSPAGEPIPWSGEIKGVEFYGHALTASEILAKTPASEVYVAPTVLAPVNPTPTNPTPTNPVPTNTNPGSTVPTPTGPPKTTPPVTPVPTNTSVTATKNTVVVADLVQFTETPEPTSVLPYRYAIITHEYKIIEVKSGHLDKVIPQAIIRVARWGISNGKKTDVANLKKGDRVELTLEKFSDHPDLEHYYTVDTLPDNFAAPYLLDTSKKAPPANTGGG